MKKGEISYILLVIQIFVIALQFSSYGIVEEMYSILRIVIIFMIFLLFSLNIKNTILSYKRYPLIKTHINVIALLSVVILVTYAFIPDIEIGPLELLT